MPGPWGSSTQPGASEWDAQRNMPGQGQFGSVPPGGRAGGGYAGEPYGSRWDSAPDSDSPVHRDETRVVGRRVVQYVIDYILAGIIPGLAYWLLDRGSGVLHGFGWAIATLIALVVYLWYWVLRPNGHHGQTFGMQLLGVRVISKGGGPANMLQYLVRGVLLIVDTFLFGLVGLITMMASRYHQRVGDHVARTLVVRAGAMTGRSGIEDERIVRSDPFAEDRYGQGLGAPGSTSGSGQGQSW